MKHHYQHIIMPNGANLYMIEMDCSETCYFTITVKAGYRYETKEEQGLGHMVEHIIFGRDLIKLFNIPQSNAYTGVNITRYEIECLSIDAPLNIKQIVHEFLNPTFTKKDIDLEKKVHLREIDYHGPSSSLSDKFKELSIHKMISENARVTYNVTPDKLKRYYKKYYHPKNTNYIITGAFDKKKIIEIIKSYNQTVTGNPYDYQKTITSDYAKYQKILKTFKYDYKFYKITTGKSYCTFTFYFDNNDDILCADILTDIIYRKMMEQLRVKRAAIYTPSSYVVPYTDPVYSIKIWFVTSNLEIRNCFLDVVKIIKTLKVSLSDNDFTTAVRNHIYKLKRQFTDPRETNYFLTQGLAVTDKLKQKPDEVIFTAENLTKDAIVVVANKLLIKNRLELNISSYVDPLPKFTL
jgi:predicted Zn-dependent peptidase